MKKTDYPELFAQPAYTEASALLAKFTEALQSAENELAAIRHAEREARADASPIQLAQAMLSGTKIETSNERERHCLTLIDRLKNAIKAQQDVCKGIKADASIKAAERFTGEHRKRTARIVDAMKELHDANVSEQALHDEITALGFDQRLPGMCFAPRGLNLNPHNPCGGYEPAWFKDASAYVSAR